MVIYFPSLCFWCPREESNLYFILRTDLFYPLNYGGKGVVLSHLQSGSMPGIVPTIVMVDVLSLGILCDTKGKTV